MSHVTYVLHFTLVLSQLRMCAMSNTAIFLFLYFFDFMLSWYVAGYFLNDLEMVPVIAIVTSIIFAFTSSSSK